MKRLVALLSAMALLVCSLPMMTFAEEEQYDDVWYTDLFYGYDSSTYLRSQHLKTYAQQTGDAMDKIFYEFMDSPSFKWGKIKTGLNAALNLGDWFKLMSDANCGTDYNYNEALDAANVLLVQYLFDKVGTGSEWGVASEDIGLAAKELESFDILLKSTNQKGLTGTEFIKSAFNYLKNSTIFSFVSDSQLTTIENAVITKSDTVAKCFSAAGDLTGAMQALLVALMMEDFRIELIDTILAECTTSMTLYDGLTRLKSQLRDGFASYFIDNYLTETVLKKLADAALDFALGAASPYKMITNIVSVVSTLLFDKLFNLADMDDMLLQAALNDYSSCLYRIMQSMWSEFDSTAFTGTRIKVYEMVFDVYIAATNAAMEASTKLTLSTNEDWLYNIWRQNIGFDYYQYKEWAEFYLEEIPNSERVMKPTDVVRTYSDFEAIMLPSDTATEGIVYLFRNAVNGNVNVKKSLTVPKEPEVTINGNVRVVHNDGKLTIEEGATLIINGNLEITGYIGYGIKEYGYVYNNGTLIVKGDFAPYSTSCYVAGTNSKIIFNGTAQQSVKYLKAYDIEVTNPAGIKYLSDVYVYGKYELHGNPLERGSYTTYLYNGAVLEDDSEYDSVYVSDTMDLRFNINGNVTVNGNLTIPVGTSYTINGNVSVGSADSVTVKAGSTLTVNGNVRVVHNDGKLTIEEGATLIINGNLEITGYIGYGIKEYGYVYNNGTLIVKGDFAPYSTSCYVAGTNSKIIFNGTAQQSVKNLKAPVIILENESEEGVVFSSAITASKLFDHKGNVFTLYNNGSGSSFADYDGDGVKDHLDAEPTVGNPCTVQFVSSDEAVGTVGTAALDTIGGTEITVTAQPSAKYELQAWVDANGKTVSTAEALTFVATGDMTYTAVFVKRSQPITVDTVGGKITAPTKAEIDSTVTVTVTENEGYIYEEGSLAMNGEAVVDNTFVMPDEPVTLTATFTYNEHYFALKDAITTAAAIGYSDWSAASFADLQSAIANARAVLENHIAADVSAQHIAALQAATEALAAKYPVALTVTQTDEQYLGVENLAANLSVLVTYDNGTTVYTTSFTATGFDAATLGEQTVTVGFEDVAQEITVTVHRRQLTDVTAATIDKQLYGGEGTIYTPKPVLTYTLTGDTLTENVDYTLSYTANTAPGTATVTVTGIGDYEGTLSQSFTIYCDHSFVVTDYQAPTCTEDGFEKKACSICGVQYDGTAEITEGLPESPHNYQNSMDKSYTFTHEGALSLVLHFSASTQTENNYDKIYLYDGADKLIGTYTGTALASKSVTVTGDTVRIRLTSDSSVVKYGFSLTSVTAKLEDGVLPATGHTYGEWMIEQEATPISEGLRYRLCEHGDDREDEAIPCTEALTTDVLMTEDGVMWMIDAGTTAAALLSQVSSAYTLTVYEGDTVVGDNAAVKTGQTLVVSGDGDIYATYTLAVTGDVSGDGAMRTSDARDILQTLAGEEMFTAAQQTAADVDGDGVVTALDVRQLLLMILGV